LESHLTQAKEFINIGKSYHLPGVGFIKSNNKGEYQLIPPSQAVKAQKKFNKPIAKTNNKKRGSGIIQVFTLLIVLSIVSGLFYEGYQYYIKPKTQNVAQDSNNVVTDTAVATNNTSNVIADSTTLNKP